MAVGSWRAALLAVGLMIGSAGAPLRAADEPARPPQTPPATQNAPGRFDPAEMVKQFKAAVYELKLNDQEKKQIDDLFSSMERDLKALNEIADPQERAQASFALFGRVQQGLSTILNDEQQQELREK